MFPPVFEVFKGYKSVNWTRWYTSFSWIKWECYLL